jgi:hypothetical protein
VCIVHCLVKREKVSASNIIANVRHAWLVSPPFVQCKKLNYVLTMVTGSQRGYCDAYCGVWRSVRLAGDWSLESGGLLCWCVWQDFGSSHLEVVFTFY